MKRLWFTRRGNLAASLCKAIGIANARQDGIATRSRNLGFGVQACEQPDSHLP